ncbi:DUF1376 domain-containing protein, partial [Sulfobacillus harzensis]
MRFPHFDFYVRDWLNDLNNRALSREERGVHIDLLAIMWQQPECRLPDNDRAIAALLGATLKEWQTWRQDMVDGPLAVLAHEDGFIFSPRLRREWQKAMHSSANKRANARKRWGDKGPDPDDSIRNAHGDANAYANGPAGAYADADADAPPNGDANAYANGPAGAYADADADAPPNG